MMLCRDMYSTFKGAQCALNAINLCCFIKYIYSKCICASCFSLGMLGAGFLWREQCLLRARNRHISSLKYLLRSVFKIVRDSLLCIKGPKENVFFKSRSKILIFRVDMKIKQIGFKF